MNQRNQLAAELNAHVGPVSAGLLLGQVDRLVAAEVSAELVRAAELAAGAGACRLAHQLRNKAQIITFIAEGVDMTGRI